MLIQYSKSCDEVLDLLKSDIAGNKKYLKNGFVLGGEVKNNKICLLLNDRYGRHSAFMSQVFCGRITGDGSGCEIRGTFRLGNLALVLLVILLAVAVESIVSAFLTKGFGTDLLFPATVIIAETVYVFCIKRSSRETDCILTEYLKRI